MKLNGVIVRRLFVLPAVLCAANGAFAQEPPPPPPGVEHHPPNITAPDVKHTTPEIRSLPPAQPLEGNFHPALGDRALVLNVSARVHDESGSETWASDGSKITLPGRPVGIRLVGDNVVCVVQFTPYIRGEGDVILIAQGQVWLELPGGGIRYETIIKTLPIKFGEQLYFFPLGNENKNGSRLEIRIDMKPYSKNPNFGRAPRSHQAKNREE
ncbi:MAG: hypothetical protein LBG72_01440 [Spirochaetaceae bacterium]|jgi:hypothetical protein|nr:hypothetical protein [Spirochaetaceae bacterium]